MQKKSTFSTEKEWIHRIGVFHALLVSPKETKSIFRFGSFFVVLEEDDVFEADKNSLHTWTFTGDSLFPRRISGQSLEEVTWPWIRGDPLLQ
jgi:hypothetical protein